MNRNLAIRLYNELRRNCPVDTGQLRSSVQLVQLNATDWQIIIGNDSGAINGTPSNQYAHITNDYATLGKNAKQNRNYRWVNKTIKRWAEQNMILFELEGDENE